ncbi:MAG: 50S ribosomal protein L30 [Dehalococcoidia bacterium]|nr:50S ribosomal protein L30 [Dehalococcoidia bacterium]
MGKLKITYKKSANGQRSVHRRTVTALGLRHLNQTVELEDSPSVRGMVESVKHMVKVERA